MSLTKLKYTEYDIWDLVTQLTYKLQENNVAWVDTYASSVGQKMIDLLAYVANLVLYSVERRAEESYLGTAQLRSSILSLTKILNYDVSRPTSATGVLKFTLGAVHSKDISIPKGTKCVSQEGYNFSTTTDTIITAGNVEAEIDSIQGEYDEVLVTSDGSEDQGINIPFVNVENITLAVTVDSVVWTEQDSLINSVDIDEHYTVSQEADDSVTVHFGNGITGKLPPLEDSIIVSFVKSDGLAGNVFEADKIITISDTIYDIDSDEFANIIVTNEGQFLGGGNTEDSEHIRYFAPRLFAAGQRAVTKEDYKALLNSYPGIADSNIWGEFEDGASPNFEMFNVVKLGVALDNWQIPDQTFKNDLGVYLQDYSMLTVKYEFEDPYFVKTILNIDLYTESDADLETVRSNVQAALEALFVPGQTILLGQKKYLSDLHTAVNDVDDVQFSHIVMKIEEDMSYNGATVRWERTIPVIPIKEGTVEIWGKKINENWVMIGKDNNFNTLVNLTGSTYLVNGSVDYNSTGESWLTVSPNDLDQVKLRYIQTDGDITTSKNQICKLTSMEFGTIQS